MDLNQRTYVRDVMSTPLETVSQDTTIEEAAQVMCEKDINALVVSTYPPSIITSSDVLEAVAAGEDTAELSVTAVMTESVETVPPDLLVEEVAAMMTTFGIKHLPVEEGDDEFVGMISSTDIMANQS